MDVERLNSPSTSVVILEVFGHRLHLSQDPNSKHLGTTVWDASMVLVKFLEKNSRKGKFCSSKLKGKRAIELGAGCGGLAGFGLALLGCDVVSTDQVEVLPLLMRNVERNTSRIMQANPDSGFGSIEVAELDWGNKDHIRAVGPPFDYIIGTDIVYVEHLLEPLLQTILALSGPKTIVLLGHEIRSTIVHEQMINMWKSNFQVKTVPKAKMDIKYQHPSIQLYIMEQKTNFKCGEHVSDAVQTAESNQVNNKAEADGENVTDAVQTTESNQVNDTDDDCCSAEEKAEAEGENVSDAVQTAESNQVNDIDDDCCSAEEKAEAEVVSDVHVRVENGKLDEWQARRCGSMAARLLRDIKLM